MTTLADRILHVGEPSLDAANYFPTGLTRVEMPANAEMLMALAKAEKPCPCPCNTRRQEGGWHRSICECLGTGQVPRFPTLREPCPDTECQKTGGAVQWTGTPYYPEGMTAYAAHEDCQGRGWVPIQSDVVEKVMEAIGVVWDIVKLQHPSVGVSCDGVVQYRCSNANNIRTATLAAAVLLLAEEEKP